MCIVVIFGLFVCHKKERNASTIVPQRARPNRTTRGTMHESSATTTVPQRAGANRTARGMLMKQGTVKGSMRYNVKVALLMKRAGDAANAHVETREACLRVREREKKSARNRLSNRLRERSQLTEGRKLRVEKSNDNGNGDEES